MRISLPPNQPPKDDKSKKSTSKKNKKSSTTPPLTETPIILNAPAPPTKKSTDGFTFGYHIVRKDGATYPFTVNNLSWAGAYGTTFFIDPSNEVIGIYLTQNDKLSDIPSWNNFPLYMLKAIKEK
jgi:CubicO group peptidase (beta-lactamase class C family)